MIETKEIKIPPKKMLASLFMQYGMPWMIAAIAGIVIFLVLGIIFSYKFFILVLIWIFLFVPLVVAFLYFFYGMKPLTAFNSIPHKLFFDEEKIRVKLMETTIDENGETHSIPLDDIKDYITEEADFENLKNAGSYVMLISKAKGMLLLPLDSFNTTEDFNNAIKIFIKNDNP